MVLSVCLDDACEPDLITSRAQHRNERAEVSCCQHTMFQCQFAVRCNVVAITRTGHSSSLIVLLISRRTSAESGDRSHWISKV